MARFMSLAALLAMVLPTGSVAQSFEGDSLEDCQTKCLANDRQCDGFGYCNVTQICEFQCTCVQHCDDRNSSWSFPLCSDYLKNCFEQAPTRGYAHLDCWTRTCPAYYAKVSKEREAGEWQGLGGWQVFDMPLPETVQFLHSARFANCAMLATTFVAAALFAARVAGRRLQHPQAQVTAELLETEDEELACVG